MIIIILCLTLILGGNVVYAQEYEYKSHPIESPFPIGQEPTKIGDVTATWITIPPADKTVIFVEDGDGFPCQYEIISNDVQYADTEKVVKQSSSGLRISNDSTMKLLFHSPKSSDDKLKDYDYVKEIKGFGSFTISAYRNLEDKRDISPWARVEYYLEGKLVNVEKYNFEDKGQSKITYP